jgi:hypothetical protein
MSEDKLLPDWFDISEKYDHIKEGSTPHEKLDPIEEFILYNEPAGPDSDKFRAQLSSLIKYVRQRTDNREIEK